MIGKSFPKLQHGLDLEIRMQHATLELQRLETVCVDHPAGFANHLIRRKNLSPFIRGFTYMGCEFEEQVGAKRNAGTNGATKQIRDRPPEKLALNVEAGDFKG
ncbi:hypothetical protein D3C80_1581750 [compost metagenome]